MCSSAPCQSTVDDEVAPVYCWNRNWTRICCDVHVTVTFWKFWTQWSCCACFNPKAQRQHWFSDGSRAAGNLQTDQTSCARGDTICLRPLQVGNICNLFARWRCCSGITISWYLFARWHLFRHVGYFRHQQQVYLWPFDLENGVQVMCDVGYLCANFSLPRPSVRELGPMYTTHRR